MRFIGDIFRLLKEHNMANSQGKLERFSFYHGIHCFLCCDYLYFDKLIVSGLIRFIKGSIALAKQPKTARDKRATKDVFSTCGGFRNLVSALGRVIGEDRIITSCKELRIEPLGDKWKLVWGENTIIS